MIARCGTGDSTLWARRFGGRSSIILQTTDHQGKKIRWNVKKNRWPVKWFGPSLTPQPMPGRRDAGASSHEGIEVQKW